MARDCITFLRDYSLYPPKKKTAGGAKAMIGCEQKRRDNSLKAANESNGLAAFSSLVVAFRGTSILMKKTSRERQ
jgi:hypothetical protein